MFTAPTAIRAIKGADPAGERIREHDLHAFRTLFLAGERTDPDTLAWAQDNLGRPVVDHWWQTESGWPIAANCVGVEQLPIKPGSPTKPVPGYEVVVLDDDARELPAGASGAICVRLPLPPGFAPTLWRGEERFVEAYLSRYPGYYMTADAGYYDEDGYLYVMGRTDDVINVAGHRLSTGQMEEVIASHTDVAECAVIGAADPLKGQIPIGFAVLKAGVGRSDDGVAAELVSLVRERIGPVASLKTVAIVDALPKTRSGKILRATMRHMADGEEWSVPPTIEDATVSTTTESCCRGWQTPRLGSEMAGLSCTARITAGRLRRDDDSLMPESGRRHDRGRLPSGSSRRAGAGPRPGSASLPSVTAARRLSSGASGTMTRRTGPKRRRRIRDEGVRALAEHGGQPA
jgi:propionyl-CoA synthetase